MPYLIVRRAETGKKLTSTFIAVLEPFSKEPPETKVEVFREDAGKKDWPVIVRLSASGKTWWVASKLSDGAWVDLPDGVPALEAKRLAVIEKK